MPDLFHNRYRIQTARAEWHGYDGGIYFVTICTEGREHYFGKIENDKEPFMQLSPAGLFVNQIITNISSYYPHVEIPLFVIMPNHIHAIVYINNNAFKTNNLNMHNCRDAINRVSTGGVTGNHNPMVTNCLGTAIRGFKARITRWAHQNNIPFGWQARFYDRIVRNQDELNRIADYIENNVANWQKDENHAPAETRNLI